MQTLNACACPRCNFFLGYSTTQPSFNHRRTALMGACLNCGYRLPIHAILRGKRPPPALPLRAAPILTVLEGPANGSRRFRRASTGTVPRHCARELRAVGQALEQQGVRDFNLRRTGQGYLIWERDSASHFHPIAPSYRFDRSDIERIERDGISRRSQRFHPVNGHKLSHLLRALGAQIERRGQRLLGLTWSADAVGVVVEQRRGRRRVEQVRADILYDLWVRMYLRRAH